MHEEFTRQGYASKNFNFGTMFFVTNIARWGQLQLFLCEHFKL